SELRFIRERYRIGADSNRMGYRLSGSPLHLLDDSQRISSAVTFGTVQLLPNGQLVILMADHQTTGGYPNLGTIIGADLPIAAQLGRNDEVKFVPVSVEAAEQAGFKIETDFALLRTGLYLRGYRASRSKEAM
ncbi:MAG: KipI antagonist, partial [Acidobacteriota bacterium]|nr:KipI antagonist [Acidobacteriota bacterium]